MVTVPSIGAHTQTLSMSTYVRSPLGSTKAQPEQSCTAAEEEIMSNAASTEIGERGMLERPAWKATLTETASSLDLPQQLFV